MQAACVRRKKLVQTLRRCALALGVERVPDILRVAVWSTEVC